MTASQLRIKSCIPQGFFTPTRSTDARFLQHSSRTMKDRRFPRRKNPPRKCKRRFEGPGGAEFKRRRVARDAKGNGLYFDSLPREALENVLRFTSEKPRHAHWKSFLQPHVALTLLKSGAVSRRALAARFTLSRRTSSTRASATASWCWESVMRAGSSFQAWCLRSVPV